MINKDITKLWPRFIGWTFVAIFSLIFGINSIVDAFQKIFDISEAEDVWEGIKMTIVSILYIIEGGLFVFFIYYSISRAYILWSRIDTIREETGIKSERAKAKSEKRIKNEQKKLQKQEKKNKKQNKKQNKNNSSENDEE